LDRAGRPPLAARGTNTLGSDPASDLRLPRAAPENAGLVIRTGNQVRFIPAPGVTATLDGAPATDAMLRSDRDGEEPEPAVLALGSARIITLQRSDRMALRVKDSEAPTRGTSPGSTLIRTTQAGASRAASNRPPPITTLKITDVTGR
jgi:hypothetical protein